MESVAPNPKLGIKLWPPSKGTRFMLVEQMTKNLATPSPLSRKYGLLTLEEAKEKAKQIEETAFLSASDSFEKEPNSDGSSAVQMYAKESSKLMMEAIKKGSSVKKGDQESSISEDIWGNGVDTIFDISGGRRAFIDAKEADELFKPLRQAGNCYTRVCFSNRSFGMEAAKVVVPILSSLKGQLKEVDLSDFIAGRPEDEALEVMKLFSSALEGSELRYLILSNNALGEKGVRAFEALLKSQNRLEELYLMNDGISEEAAQAVNELIPTTDNLKILHFHNNMTGDVGALAISEMVKRSPLLEDFRCSSTRIGSEGGITLAESLVACSHLRKLDLRDNMFGVEAGVSLSKVLKGFANLTEIYLSYLNLEDEGAEAIAAALKDFTPSLEILDIAGNEITAKGAAKLAAALSRKQFLTKLYLSENALKDEGADLIAQVLKEGHGQLSELDMSCNAIRSVGARALAHMVVDKPGFKVLNIDGNFIPDEVIDEIKGMLKACPGVLGPLDDNDPEGESEEESAEENEDDDGLELKMKGLDIKQDD